MEHWNWSQFHQLPCLSKAPCNRHRSDSSKIPRHNNSPHFLPQRSLNHWNVKPAQLGNCIPSPTQLAFKDNISKDDIRLAPTSAVGVFKLEPLPSNAADCGVECSFISKACGGGASKVRRWNEIRRVTLVGPAKRFNLSHSLSHQSTWENFQIEQSSLEC